MELGSDTIINILIDKGYITEDDGKNILKLNAQSDEPILSILLGRGLITPDLYGQALAEFYKVPYTDLNSRKPKKSVVLELDQAVAKKYKAVIAEKDEKKIVISTDNPDNEQLATELAQLFPGFEVAITYSLAADIEDVLTAYRKPLEEQINKIIQLGEKVAPELLREIIHDAVTTKVSDIHMEPFKKHVTIRYRLDGVLSVVGRVEHKIYNHILNKIKVEARMRTDQHFSAQDGALRLEHEDYSVDVRVSIVPTVDGEKVVMRLLSSYVQGLKLDDLGLLPYHQEMLRKQSKKPYGMILVTGPTGSGKTTTLYGLLKEISNPEINVSTIEDPVEYKIKGVNHIQVNNETNLTFAQGLRSIVRQDPDIILVGEVRDFETADIAVNAALTGHLLFTTFHANNAASTLPRLITMGVEPYLLATTLNLVVAQRLVRKICDNCRVSVSPAEYQKVHKSAGLVESMMLKHLKQETLYYGKGCEKCNDTGYSGRTALFEMIEITPSMEDIITNGPTALKIIDQAKKEGMRDMYDDGVEKVKLGVTTIAEVARMVNVLKQHIVKPTKATKSHAKTK